jgi:hypothetical protein
MSTDSLDFTPRVKSMKRNLTSRAADLLKEFTLSPLVTNSVHLIQPTNKPIEMEPFDAGQPSFCEMATPSFDSRRCSTAFKDLPEKVKKPRGVSPRELFNQEMPFEVPESRMSSATFIADSADRRASSETYIADRRASNETYVAEKRLSSDTYVLSNSLSFEGASGDSVVLPGSPATRSFTPMLADVQEESPEVKESLAWEINQTCEVDSIDKCVEILGDISGIEPQTCSSSDTLSRTVTRSTRKRCAAALESVQFTPFKSLDEEEDVVPRYSLRSAGKAVKVQHVQTVSSVSMEISPPKKFKIPTLDHTEKSETASIKSNHL